MCAQDWRRFEPFAWYNSRMESENSISKTTASSVWNQVTPLSKYLATTLFIAMPFVGGWIGYQYAPEKVVEVEKVANVTVDTVLTKDNVAHIADTHWDGVYNIINGDVYYTDESTNIINMSDVYIIDTDSFQPLNTDVEPSAASIGYRVPYAKDNKSVFMGPYRISNADPQTFEFGLVDKPWSYVWSKDKNNVYFKGVLVRSAEPETFEVITEGSQKDCGYLGYGNDKYHIYYGTEVIFLADPITFVVLPGGYSKDEKNTFFKTFRTTPPENEDYCGGLG